MREVNPNGSRVVPGGWCSLRVRVLLCYHQLSLFLIVVAVFIIATTGRRTKKNYYYLFFLIKKKTNNNNNNNKWLQSNSRAISDRFTAVPKWFRINSRAILLNSFRFFGCRGERGGDLEPKPQQQPWVKLGKKGGAYRGMPGKPTAVGFLFRLALISCW